MAASQDDSTSGRAIEMLITALQGLEARPDADAGAVLSAQLSQLRTVTQSQADAVVENTRAVLDNTVAQATAGARSILADAGKSALSILGSGLGLTPVVSGIIKLFGGGKQAEAPPPLTVYERPAPIQLETALIRSGAVAAPSMDSGARLDPVVTQAPQIKIEIQAMDARSFLDRGDDIARAVRKAMLNSNALNDTVNEL